MKRFVLLLMLSAAPCWATSYTDFYVIGATGNNLFSGHTPDTTYTFQSTSGYWTNNTTSAVFFKSGLNPVAGGVTNGAWAACYYDGATTNAFVGLVTAADDTADTITVSLTAKSGTAMASNEYGTNTITIGGAWRGPNNDIAYTGASDPRMMHPFNFVQSTMTNTSGNAPYVNFTGTFDVTNAMTHAQSGPIIFGGYGSAPRDETAATIKGSTAPAAFVILTLSATDVQLRNFVICSNGPAGAAVGVLISGIGSSINKSYVYGMGRQGVSASGNAAIVSECVFSTNNLANTATVAGCSSSGSGTLIIRCISRYNLTANAVGFSSGSTDIVLNSVAHNNGSAGFYSGGGDAMIWIGCDAWSNNASGLQLAGSTPFSFYIENCNFFKNNGHGIYSSGGSAVNGIIANVMFGSGTQTNTSENIQTNLYNQPQAGVWIVNSNSYAENLTPWVDPTNGNFSSLSGASGRAAGAGSFGNYVILSPTNTLSYPDIGAAQGANTNASGSTTIHRAIFSP